MSSNSKGAYFYLHFYYVASYDGEQNFKFLKLELAIIQLIKSHLDLSI